MCVYMCLSWGGWRGGGSGGAICNERWVVIHLDFSIVFNLIKFFKKKKINTLGNSLDFAHFIFGKNLHFAHLNYIIINLG